MRHALQDQILDIIARCKDMTIATVRPDGAPQATVVSFVHDGLTLYFGCGADSQKAANIAQEPRVSLTLTPTYDDWQGVEGLSIAARATAVDATSEIEAVSKLMMARFPEIAEIAVEPTELKIFRLRPELISVLDYAKGFGHTELVSVGAEDIAETLESMKHHWLAPVSNDRLQVAS